MSQNGPFPFLDCQGMQSPACPQQLLSQSLWNVHCDVHAELWVFQLCENQFHLSLALRIIGDPVIIMNGILSEHRGMTAGLGLGGTCGAHKPLLEQEDAQRAGQVRAISEQPAQD